MIYFVVFIVIFLDQLTKILVVSEIGLHQAVAIMPYFNLVHTLNRGVSFSFLTSDSPLMPWFLSGFSLAMCGLIIYWMCRTTNRWERIGLSLVLGGAIGNVIDRIRLGAVIDFLDFYIGDYHWPAFNVADSAICIGVAFIIITSFWKGKK